jgi:hypothetical protein
MQYNSRRTGYCFSYYKRPSNAALSSCDLRYGRASKAVSELLMRLEKSWISRPPKNGFVAAQFGLAHLEGYWVERNDLCVYYLCVLSVKTCRIQCARTRTGAAPCWSGFEAI